MFTRLDLIATLPNRLAAAPPPIDVVEFGQHDFYPPDSEQSLRVYRGLKANFESGLQFWMTIVRSLDWKDRESDFNSYLESALCEPICAGDFFRIVDDCTQALQQPLPTFLELTTEFRAGLNMYSDWNDVAAMAELSEEYIAIFWSTTA